jgi:hypothetical protein
MPRFQRIPEAFNKKIAEDGRMVGTCSVKRLAFLALGCVFKVLTAQTIPPFSGEVLGLGTNLAARLARARVCDIVSKWYRVVDPFQNL